MGIRVLGRGIYQCDRYRGQTSVKAGTLPAGRKPTLTKWLLDLFLLTQPKTGISALRLSRQLGFSHDSIIGRIAAATAITLALLPSKVCEVC